MTAYWVLISLVILLQFKVTKLKKEQYYKYVFIIIALFIFAAMRGNGDGDYFTYLTYSKDIRTLGDVFNNSFPMEIGFRIIAYFVNTIRLNSQFVLIIMNAISIFFINKFIKNYSLNPLLSLFLYLPLFFQFDMHATRTAVAYSICTYGFKYILDKKFLKFMFFLLLGMCFHNAALIFVIAYFLANKNIRHDICCCYIFLYWVITPFINIDSIILYILKLFDLTKIYNRFLVYTTDIRFGQAFSVFDPRLLLLLFIYVLMIFVVKKPNKFEKIMTNILLVNIFIILFFIKHTIFVVRLSSFFNVFTIIYIPVLLNKLRKSTTSEKAKIYITFLTIFIYVFYLIGILHGYVEYKLFV